MSPICLVTRLCCIHSRSQMTGGMQATSPRGVRAPLACSPWSAQHLSSSTRILFLEKCPKAYQCCTQIGVQLPVDFLFLERTPARKLLRPHVSDMIMSPALHTRQGSEIAR